MKLVTMSDETYLRLKTLRDKNGTTFGETISTLLLYAGCPSTEGYGTMPGHSDK